MITHLRKTLDAQILFCKTGMETEHCYYKKFLKAKLITSRQVPSLLFLKRYVQPLVLLNSLNVLKLYHSRIHHDCLSFIFLSFTFRF